MATRTLRSAAGGLNQFAAIKTNGILTDMLLFSPGRVSLEVTTAIHHQREGLDMVYRVHMDQRKAQDRKSRCQR